MNRQSGEPDNKAIARSGRLYERLLAAYPQEHRRNYGPAMAQLFRDQCRDAWRNHRGWGLLWLWLRVLPDLVKTSVAEHMSALKERKTMLERLGSILRPRFAPLFVFIAASVTVFLLVVVTSTVITLLLPELYSSTARLKVDRPTGVRSAEAQSSGLSGGYDPSFIQSQCEAIASPQVLDNVIERLDLNRSWGKKYAKGQALERSQTLVLLKSRLDLRSVPVLSPRDLRPIRNGSLIEIRIFSESPDEAAALANAVAESYRESRSEGPRPEMVDRAIPGLRPVQPNKPLNIALGIIGGGLLGLVAGALVAGLAAWLGRRCRKAGPPPPAVAAT